MKKILLGGGCFWCIEALLRQKLKGVKKLVSGYAGGKLANPDYRSVCSGMTGHAEVVEVSYDDEILPTETLLRFFFEIHDPTTLNRQGADVGTQYRSVIFYEEEEQKETAEKIMEELTANKRFSGPIVTELSPAPDFYPAEEEHQNYYSLRPEVAYCKAVIEPKLRKFENP